MLENENPTLYVTSTEREENPDEFDDSVRDLIDSREIFDLIRNINDPEHPHTLEELNVIQLGWFWCYN